jgi:DNA helicase HerA-like ATPase
MNADEPLYLGKGDKPVCLNMKMANRHGLIAGATGTGKTVTLRVMAEGFSDRGVPVFIADAKGDLSGLCLPGEMPKPFVKRAEEIGLENYSPRAYPVAFWDLFGKKGHRLRTTVSEIGPLLLSRMLDLNDTQEGVLYATFQIADDEGMLLLDLKDLRAMLNFVGENAKALSSEYGNITRASIGAIQRRLLVLQQQGGKQFLGEPALDIRDFMRTADDGRGYINLLAADKLMQQPRLYATFLLWLMSELFEEMPEIGDVEKPRLVFFFDEAHLLFDDAPKSLIDKVEQVVRLIRSKGVGIYFITQSPLDIPDEVLGQLGNRVQHALRAFTPRDQKAVRAAADTFRANPGFSAAEAIKNLGVGEALVSTLTLKGAPGVVQITRIRPPCSGMKQVTAAKRREIMEQSELGECYDTSVDRKSAYELLAQRAEKAAEAERAAASKRNTSTRKSRSRSSGRKRQGVMETLAKSVARSIGSSFGRRIMRGILGSLLKG